MSDLGKLALSYARQGFHVFPLRPLSKIPATSNGFHAATTDAEIISAWWEENEEYNIGIRTGKESGISVIDLDGMEGRRSFSASSIMEEGSLDTLIVKTPSGGCHLIYDYNPDLKQTAGLLPNVDVRNDGGYIVANGSRVDTGAGIGEYTIEVDAPIAPLPAWILDLQKKKKTTPKEGHTTPEEGEVGEGGRNAYLAKVGGALRRQAIDQDAIEEILLAINERKCDPPLDDNEVLTVARSVSRYEPDPDEIPSSTIVKVQDTVERTFKYLSNKDLVKGEPTGFDGLDALLGGGLRTGELVALHAQAKTGKNTWLHRVILNLLNRKIPVGYASRELHPEREVNPDLISKTLKKNAWKDELPEAELAQAVADWPLYYSYGQGYFPIQELKEWVKNLKAQYGVKYFFMDHLHYMLLKEEWQQAAELIRVLKSLVNSQDICIVLIVQPTQPKEDGGLGLHTLKGGSSIGQAIDTLINMEHVKDESGERMKDIRKLTVAEVRHKLASRGTIYLQYDKETTDIVEAEREEAPNPTPSFHGGISFRKEELERTDLLQLAKKWGPKGALQEIPPPVLE
jgi:KaiC/GvpD/RAD55 family RecA-like ATPase